MNHGTCATATATASASKERAHLQQREPPGRAKCKQSPRQSQTQTQKQTQTQTQALEEDERLFPRRTREKLTRDSSFGLSHLPLPLISLAFFARIALWLSSEPAARKRLTTLAIVKANAREQRSNSNSNTTSNSNSSNNICGRGKLELKLLRE